jgi:hypothetical protein
MMGQWSEPNVELSISADSRFLTEFFETKK